MTEIKPGDWVALESGGGTQLLTPLVKLPTDPRTLIRVYRAVMKWYSRNNADEDASLDLCWDLWETMENAKKAKRVK